MPMPTKNNTVQLSIIVPVYKEEENINPFLKAVLNVLQKMDITYEIIFSMDPSPDQTEFVILDNLKTNPNIKLLKLSRRFGQPAATLAGINYASGDAAIIMDVDLQDPPDVIPLLYNKFLEGFDVVNARRISRQGEYLIRKIITKFGYYLINKLSDVNIPRDVGDFRLISSRVCKCLSNMKEKNFFLKGLVSYIGFNQTEITYNRKKRHAGTANYNQFFGSIPVALNGIFCFSSYPLHLVSIIAFFSVLTSIFLALLFLINKIFNFNVIPGLTTTNLLILLSFSVIMFSLGIISQYLYRMFDEIKVRPVYFVDKFIDRSRKKD